MLFNGKTVSKMIFYNIMVLSKMQSNPLQIIFATTKLGVFKYEAVDILPWSYKPDLRFFSVVTTSDNISSDCDVVIMGNKTFKSLPKELPNRIHFVLTKEKIETSEEKKNNIFYFNDVKTAIDTAFYNYKGKVSVIGGLNIIYETLQLNYNNVVIYHSIIPDEFVHQTTTQTVSFDTSKILSQYKPDYPLQTMISNMFPTCNVIVHTYKHSEYQYLDMIRYVLANGTLKQNRTETDAISCNGYKMEFNLEMGFPITTTKSVNFENIKKEFLWFLNGDTDSKTLEKQGVNIWTKNSDIDFHTQRLQSIVTSNPLDNELKQTLTTFLNYPEGDIGPMYHHQWRHWGANYITCKTEYKNQGIDQIKKLIRQIKSDPYSRRHIVSSWNVNDLDKMVLNPCHTLFQFSVDNQKHLTCMLYQRSGDIGLGIPYNIASYALLTHIIANICELIPSKLIIFIADAHIYANHLTELQTQLTREPKPLPTLVLKKQFVDIDDITTQDIDLINYNSHPFIKMKMAV